MVIFDFGKLIFYLAGSSSHMPPDSKASLASSNSQKMPLTLSSTNGVQNARPKVDRSKWHES